ncbi:MAG: histidine triad family protein [Gaiellales bacterium]|nr:histidine triad family protein [Gaiellales bacterium]
MQPDCLVCRELAGDVALPGGLVWEGDLAAAFHVPPLPERGEPYLGHVLVVTRRHVAGLGDLSEEEGAAVGRGAVRMARALVAAGATWVHSAVVGLDAPHFHLHLLPRYGDTPRGTPWHAVDEWEGARRGGAAEIVELVGRLRAAALP